MFLCVLTGFICIPFLEFDAGKGRHIFTADKAAIYLIYGWVKFSNITDELPELRQIWNEDVRTLSRERIKQTEMFFFTKVTLVSNSSIRLLFSKTEFVDNCFHIYEL